MSKDEVVLLCVRVADNPVMTEYIASCNYCGESVSITPASLDAMKATGLPRKYCCNQCAKCVIGDDKDFELMPTTDAQVKELQEIMNKLTWRD